MDWQFYGDDSDFCTIDGGRISNVRMFGGFYINKQNLSNLFEDILAVKKKHLQGAAHAPVKWNIKSLKSYYEDLDSLHVYDLSLSSADPLRSELLALLTKHSARIRVCAVVARTDNKEALKNINEYLNHMCYVMVLQRLGMAKLYQMKEGGVEIVIDWPTANNQKLFTEEYTMAYLNGETSPNTDYPVQKYKSGPLKAIGFYPAQLFSQTASNPFLQLADLVVGVTRELLMTAFQVPSAGNKFTQMFPLIKAAFDSDASGQVLGRGLVVDPLAPEIEKQILPLL